MAELIRHGQSTQARVYSEDNDLVGIVVEFDIPDVEFETVEHETLGSIAVFKAPSRPLQALEGSVKFQFPEPELMTHINNPTIARTYQVHKVVDVWGPDGLDVDKSYTLVVTVRLQFVKNALGTAKLGDNEMVEADFTCNRMRQTIHATGRQIMAVDVFAGTHEVGDSPVWPS